MPPRFPPAPGPDDFRQLREGGWYYVDKTPFIAEWLASPDQVLLLPRPRRFGKTLNLSMLRCWLEVGPDHRALFDGLAVSRAGADVSAHQGQHPVIFITFKDVKEPDFASALARMGHMVARLYREHEHLVSGLSPSLQALFSTYLSGEPSAPMLRSALRNLCDVLHEHHRRPVVMLIDEYDAPIEAGFEHGYFEEIVDLMRGMLGTALKTNPSLYRAVLTGVRRVSKESLFSDLNNVRVSSMLEPAYRTSFGFTEPEVADVLAAAGRAEMLPEVRAWYNGYLFAGQVIYNPWSVLCFARDGLLRDYWVQTSSDALLRHLLLQSEGLEGEFEVLLRGGTIEKPIDEHASLRDLERETGRVWSVLLTGGYLKATGVRYEAGEAVAALSIPNLEVSHVWRRSFAGWLERRAGGEPRLRSLHRAILAGNAADVQDLLEPLVQDALSFHDTGAGSQNTPERVYHAFILGLLVSMDPTHRVSSNRESGLGRADVLIVPRQPGAPGVVLEFKRVRARQGETPEQALSAAHAQMQARNYRAELEVAGAVPIHTLAVVFDGKAVWVG